MDKLTMHTPNLADENYAKLAALFPNAVTESIDPETGEVVRAIDKDVLMQEINTHVVEGREERYQFTWPDKRKAVLAANAPISAALRPVRADSVGKDGTPGGWDSENLYIEGDNLDVLKLLRETYLGKVKMIYIDPPYNTGKDFIFKDNFSEDMDSYMSHSGQYDEEGNCLVQNLESNGRFHTDWLNMMYPRLRVAKDLLADDGFVFISVDEKEFENMTKIASEILGRVNLRNCIAVRRGIKNVQAQFNSLSSLAQGHEYILLFSKNQEARLPKLYDVFDETKKGKWDTFWRGTNRPTMRYELFGKCPDRGQWRWEKGRAQRAIRNYEIYIEEYSAKMSIDDYYSYILTSSGAKTDFVRQNDEGTIQYYVPPQEGKLISDNWMDIMMTGTYTVFDTEKSLDIMERIVGWITKDTDIILDFFSGSATTAHAVMQLNAEDGGHRQFIMVQLPESCDEKSEAYKAGYKNICEIGKERIRRAGRKIKEEAGMTAQDLDIGFRVLRLDSSNMQDVYYNPAALTQSMLDMTTDNIKPDRTPEDLLFQVMLELGVLPSSEISETTIDGHKVFDVADGFLLACFDAGVTTETVTAIAKRHPYYAVFRDSSLQSDSVAANFEQIFETYSPSTVRRVL